MVVSAKGVHFTIRSDRNIAFGKSQKYHCKFFAVGDIFPFSLIWFPHCKTCLAPQNDFGMPKNNFYEPPTHPSPFLTKKLMESVPNHNHEYDDTKNRFCFYFTRAGPTLGGLRFPIPAPVKSNFRVSSRSSFDFFINCIHQMFQSSQVSGIAH